MIEHVRVPVTEACYKTPLVCALHFFDRADGPSRALMDSHGLQLQPWIAKYKLCVEPGLLLGCVWQFSAVFGSLPPRLELHNWFVVTSARTGPQHRYSSSNPTLNGTPLAASLLQTLHTAPEQHFQPRHERQLQNSTLSTFLKKKVQFKHFTSHHSVVIRSTCGKAYPVSSSPSSPIIPSCQPKELIPLLAP